MTKFFRPLLLLLLVVLVSAIVAQAGKQREKPPTTDANGIEWYNYEAGWEKAKAERKHLFVDFTAVWCGWCKRLERDTFAKAQIKRYLTDDFVPVKIWEKETDTLDLDGFRISTRDLRLREFGVKSYPTMWFVSPDGVRIGPVRGYVQADQLAKYLDIVKYYRYDSTRDESGNPIESKQP